MSSSLSQYYDSVVINGKVWFICKYRDCDDCELTEEEIHLHVSQHLDPSVITPKRELIDDPMPDSPPDIKPQIITQLPPNKPPIATHISQSSGGSQEDSDEDLDEEQEMIFNSLHTPNGFQCHINGCGKTFLYLKSLMQHRNDHKVSPKPAAIRPNTSVIKANPIAINANPEVGKSSGKSKQTVNQTMSFYNNQIKQKYLRVQRLNDRSIHRWQKQDHRSDANYAGMQSLKNLSGYYRKDIIENEKFYFCEYNQSCPFRTKRSQHMARHLNCCHFRTRIFKCTHRGCNKFYYNPTSLRQHTLNHKCGFGILNGKTMASLCGNKSINRFRKRIIENDEKIYKCDFLDCPFKTRSHTCIKRHIHDQHLCPNRVKYLDNEALASTPSSTAEQIPQMSQMPQISGIPEMIEIPVAPEMMSLPAFPAMIPAMRDMPSIKIKQEIKQEFGQMSSQYAIHDMIDRLIDGENNMINTKFFKNYNPINANMNGGDAPSEEDEDEEEGVQVVHEVLAPTPAVSDEFKQLIEDKNVKLDFSQSNYTKCKTELDKLNRCRAHFDRRVDENKGVRFVCKCCQFPAKSLESISLHLRLKHFIDN